MHKLLLALYWLLCTLNISAQPDSVGGRISDYLSVKKRNGVTLANYYPGMDIRFFIQNGQEFSGPIAKIANDSIYVSFYQTIKQPTIWGTYFVDTIRTDVLPFHYKDITNIVSFRSTKTKHYLRTLGTLLKLGGGGYFIVNTVNSLRDNEPLFSDGNGTRLAISAAAMAGGWLMTRHYNNLNRISRKTRIVYVNMQ